jgi:hypothetical protein
MRYEEEASTRRKRSKSTLRRNGASDKVAREILASYTSRFFTCFAFV